MDSSNGFPFCCWSVLFCVKDWFLFPANGSTHVIMLIRMYMRRKSRLNLNSATTILREEIFIVHTIDFVLGI